MAQDQAMHLSPQQAYHELAFYTLSLRDEHFIHQHVVDAFTAQQATHQTKPIALFYALAGLYLQLEKNYSGKQVQRAHVQFSKKTKNYPAITLPKQRGNITIQQVLQTTPGQERHQKITEWCRAVWQTYRDEHHTIITHTEALLKT